MAFCSTASIAFDLEGTLVDTEAFHFLAFERALSDVNIQCTTVYILSIPGAVGGGDPYIAQRLGERFSIEAKAVLDRKKRHFEALLRDQRLMPRPGVEDFLEQILSAGYKVTLGSITPRERGESILRQSGLAGFFREQRRVFREDVEKPKPAPEVYLQTARLCGVDPSRQLVFEDSPVGIQAARGAESMAIAVPTAFFQEQPSFFEELENAGAQDVWLQWPQEGARIIREKLESLRG